MSTDPDEPIYNINILSQELLLTPEQVKARVVLSEQAKQTVLGGRKQLQKIIDRKDHRLFVVIGPCSIHDLKSATEYAHRLRELSKKVADTLLVIMRVYFEKPRTSVGWKGLINDPHLDDSFHIDEGLVLARKFLLEVAELGLLVGTEALDPITPQYLQELISWTAIGARTAESQTHREMASGLSTPIGFKNGTDGSIQGALNSLKSVSQPHHFLGINLQGQCAVFHTRGNRYAHIVLRGGLQPNYDSVSVALCEAELDKAKLPVNIVIDCSHGNSLKKHELQPLVLENCVNQILEGNKSIVGLMLESNLFAGNQVIPEDLKQLRYGVSITDPCIDWETTEKVILSAQKKLRDVLPGRRILSRVG